MIIIGHGRLDAPDRGKPVADLLAAYEPDLRQGLASQQIQLGGAKGPARGSDSGTCPA